MNIRTRLHMLLLLFSAVSATQASCTMSQQGKQENQGLAQAQHVIKSATVYRSISEQISDKFRFKRLDERHAYLGGICSMGMTAFAQCSMGTCSEIGLFWSSAVPALIGLLAYGTISSHTTTSYYQDALKQARLVVNTLADDPLFNHLIEDENIEGYVFAQFGAQKGALNIIDHYQGLYHSLKCAKDSLDQASETRDVDLAAECGKLRGVINSISEQLIQTISTLLERFKDEYTMQRRQVHRAYEKNQALLAAQQKQLKTDAQLEKDRAAAILAGNINYDVAVKHTK